MNDEEIGNILRKLPRVGTSEGFTRSVMARVEGSRRRAPRVWMVAALIAAVLGVGGMTVDSLLDREEPADTREELLAEAEQLERELAELRRLTEQLSPEVELGTRDGQRYVLATEPFHDPTVVTAAYEF